MLKLQVMGSYKDMKCSLQNANKVQVMFEVIRDLVLTALLVLVFGSWQFVHIM